MNFNRLTSRAINWGVACAALLLCACSETFVDSRDGRSYKMVQIGNLTWMAENLRFMDVGSGNADGAAGAAVDAAEGSVTVFAPDGDEKKLDDFGSLYTWAAAKVACPEGWRLPTSEDMDALLAAAGEKPGAALKSSGGWFKKGNGSDDLDFAAVPAGFKNPGGKFDGIGGFAQFWSGAENEEDGSAYYLGLEFGSDRAFLKSDNKYAARSVRCVR